MQPRYTIMSHTVLLILGIAFLTAFPSLGKIWGPLSFDMTRSELDAVLRSNPAFEPPGEMTVMGSTSENDRFVTRKTFFGDPCELMFRFNSNDQLSSIAFISKTGFEPNFYKTRFRARYKNLYMTISDRYGLPLECPAWPDPSRLKPGRIAYLHTWHVDSGQSSILTGILRDHDNKCYVATAFVRGKIKPGRTVMEMVKDWDKVPEFLDLKTADKYNAQGMSALAIRNGKVALSFFEKAAALGSSRAYWAMGVLYEGGKGIPKDEEKSQKCYRIAAEKGFALATVLIDKKYDQAMKTLDIFPEDAQAILSTCQRAAAEGCIAEQFNVGTMFKNGYGLPKDMKKAEKWLSAAAKKGDLQAASALRSLAK